MRLSSPRWDRRGSGRGCRSIRSICITSPRRWDTPRCSRWAWRWLSPEREVIAFNGDGCMLMSLGCLVTIVASGAKNLTLIVLENGVYEVTGGQHTAGDAARVDFIGMARAAGFTSSSAIHRSRGLAGPRRELSRYLARGLSCWKWPAWRIMSWCRPVHATASRSLSAATRHRLNSPPRKMRQLVNAITGNKFAPDAVVKDFLDRLQPDAANAWLADTSKPKIPFVTEASSKVQSTPAESDNNMHDYVQTQGPRTLQMATDVLSRAADAKTNIGNKLQQGALYVMSTPGIVRIMGKYLPAAQRHWEATQQRGAVTSLLNKPLDLALKTMHAMKPEHQAIAQNLMRATGEGVVAILPDPAARAKFLVSVTSKSRSPPEFPETRPPELIQRLHFSGYQPIVNFEIKRTPAEQYLKDPGSLNHLLGCNHLCVACVHAKATGRIQRIFDVWAHETETRARRRKFIAREK